MVVGENNFTLLPGERQHIDGYWNFIQYKVIANHSHSRYSNSLIFGLYRVDCVVTYPEEYIRTYWCDIGQSYSAFGSENSFNQGVQGKDFWVSPSGTGKIKRWREAELPEPVPEPEPGPIDEGGGILDGVWDTLKEWIQQAITAGLAFLEEPLNIIRGLIASLSQTISGIVSAVSSAIDTVMAQVVGMFDIIVDKIKGVIDAVWNNLEQIWETLKTMFRTVKDAIVQAFETSWVFIKETFTELWGKIKNGLTYIGDQIVAGLKYLWDVIQNALNWTWEILKGAYTAIVDTATAVWNRTKEKLTETIESIKAGFGDAIDRLTTFFEWFIDGYIKELRGLSEWTEDRMVETIKFMLKAQRKVLDELE